ncbi:MAG: hypothetical protein HY318_20470 [Armatimonadetes bacterium]|nr:hypothetical protein [Armatimonadota bacterium]
MKQKRTTSFLVKSARIVTRCWIIFAALFLPMTGVFGGESATEGGLDSSSIRVSISRSFLVRGQPIRLTATRVGAAAHSAGPATVSFMARLPNRKEVRIGQVKSAGSGPVSINWTPRELGWHGLWCEADFRGLTINSLGFPAFVAPHPLHFNYWGCSPKQLCVTSILAPKDESNEAASWASRGVQLFRWKWGNGIAKEWQTPEKYAEDWQKIGPYQSGIMIDEFGGGDEIDQRMGRALVLTRTQSPNLFLAPYCLRVAGDDMVAGFKAADLVLVECYVGDWRSYRAFDDRFGSTRPAGLSSKSLVALGVGGGWITTEKELRQQVAYLRSVYPEMPGIAFFPVVPNRLTNAVDRVIEDYYLNPALQLTIDAEGRQAQIRNIGCLTARGVMVLLASPDGKSQRRFIKTIQPDQSARLAVPEGATAQIEAAPERYTVVEYRSPLQESPPLGTVQAEAAKYRDRFKNGEAAQPLATNPKVEVSLSKPEKPESKSSVESATIEIPPSRGRSVAISFDVELGRVWFYGTVGVKLVGEDSSLGFEWCHHEPDTDVHPDVPRASFTWAGPRKDSLHETIPPAMGPERKFRFFAAYDGGTRSVRGMLLRSDGSLMWDTGNLPTGSSFQCDRLKVDVTPFEGSEIRYDPTPRRLFLRGVSGGPLPSPYVNESWISNLEISY